MLRTQPHLGLDLRQVFYPSEDQAEAATQHLRQTAITQPALFVIEYALAVVDALGSASAGDDWSQHW